MLLACSLVTAAFPNRHFALFERLSRSDFRIPHPLAAGTMADSQQHAGGVIVTALGIDAPMHVWDAVNGALLFSFKSNACVPRSELCALGPS